jgi:SAM-dependent methyltransferase
MHDTAMKNGERFFATYLEYVDDGMSILEIGAQNINGSLRQLCPGNAKYVGVDFKPYKGVDVVLEDPYKLPLGDESFDVVVSSSCFEHSALFWLTYQEIMRVLKPDGLFYLSVPSNGPYHQYPVDCWRFYPDSGGALVEWGWRNGMKNAVLESYMCNPMVDGWADFVCVFIKDEGHARRYPRRILNAFTDYTNGVIRGQSSDQKRMS